MEFFREEKFGENNFLALLIFGKSSKSVDIVSSGPIIFAHLS